MRVLIINVVCGIRSTGRICTDIAIALETQGHDSKIAYSRENVPKRFQKYAIRIGAYRDVIFHVIKARLFDRAGFGSTIATKRFVEWIKTYNPDIIHLHNIHGYYLNIELLFDYLRTSGKLVIWSLYDCWSFTGHCAHYDYNKCDGWLNGCEKCIFKAEYPRAYFSRSKRNFLLKKAFFTRIPNLNIVAPSIWMKEQVQKSFLRYYPIHVLPNGINVQMFQPSQSNFREKFKLFERFIVLGVSSFWNEQKGLLIFNELAKRLPITEYKIVLVGSINSSFQLNDNILHVDGTDSIKELCEIYTSANVFVNPTLQETQGLTTIEAFACGTPAVVFDSGGATECITEKTGVVVEKGNICKLIEAIESIHSHTTLFSSEDCIAQAVKYSNDSLIPSFLNLYYSLLGEK